MSSPKILPFVIKLLEKKEIDYDDYIHNLSKSFPNGNFFENIRNDNRFRPRREFSFPLAYKSNKKIKISIKGNKKKDQNLGILIRLF